MGYRAQGRLHALWMGAGHRSGQGTVEYVALVLLVAVILAGVVAATRKTSIGDGGIAITIVKQLKGALEGVVK